MKTFFVVRYPSTTDLFTENGDVLTEKEYRIAAALIPEMRVIEIHSNNRVYNDDVSPKGWREQWGV